MNPSLNDRIRVERRADASDGQPYSDGQPHSDNTLFGAVAIDDLHGNFTAGWRALINLRATIEELRGGESIQAAKLAGKGLVKIRIRSSPQSRSIRPEDRIINRSTGITYNIRHIEDSGRNNDFLTILCERGVADG